jgi:DNA mismatch repair protein MutS2
VSFWSDSLLEFGALNKILARYVHTPSAREALQALTPSADLLVVREALADVAEAMDYQRQAVDGGEGGAGASFRLRFSTLPDPSPALRKLRVEGLPLEAQEIVGLLRFLERAQSFRAQLLEAAARFPRLASRVEPLADFRAILKRLEGKVLPDGSISDDASPFLRRVRKDIERQRRELEVTLERFLRKFRDEGVLQEDFVTQRNERYVLPVQAGHKGRVDGIVHGASGSGQTLYLEPLEVLGMNNDLVRLQNEELEEIRRILDEITQVLRGQYTEIREAAAVVTGLELLFGKADFGEAFSCTVPQLRDEGPRRLWLKQARHPLLEDVLRKQGRAVVPVSLELTEAQRTLLISGPNTGGKTVALKTVGLLVLMAQSGLPVPCHEAELPVFSEVLADIGDNQSIAESLSTFSSHVLRLKEMMTQVSANSLVILDEIGRATDPEEGGALAVAITDTFRERGAFTLVSTHLMPMKVYGANRDEVLNGSMGFNEATLEPTYQLRLGAPGKSAGLDIARRLGIDPDVLEKARATISRKEEDLARLIATLHARLEDVAEQEARAQSKLAKLKRRDDKLSLVWKRRESEKLRDLEARYAEVLQRFETEGKQLLERMAESGDSRRSLHHAQVSMAKARREIREDLEQVVARVQQGTPEPPPAAQLDLQPGARLKLRDIREAATLIRLLEEDRIEVQIGFMKVQVPRADVKEVLDAQQPQGKVTLPRNVSFTAGPSAHVLQRELNIIGQTEEEGIEQTERFLDQALLAEVGVVRIVHGHGKGILKRAVHNVLSRNPNVAKFYAASPSEGGAGATIAELRED